MFNDGYPVNATIQTFSRITPLMHCAAVGQPEALEEILKQDPNVDQRDTTGQTALHYCC